MAGVSPDTFSAYVSRGQAPKPRRKVGWSSVWDEDEIKTWLQTRPGRAGRPRLTPKSDPPADGMSPSDPAADA